MRRFDIIKVYKETNYKIDFKQTDGSFIQEDSYAISIGETLPDGFRRVRSIGELTKDELTVLKEEIENILKA